MIVLKKGNTCAYFILQYNEYTKYQVTAVLLKQEKTHLSQAPEGGFCVSAVEEQEANMLHHVEFNVSDLERSIAFGDGC